ncbi:MAG: hypothetical protein LBV27_08490 [Oscillospiraceae bacterium]|jgi:hypothetical protein|nr:hypothetical protein [Oscillospiraceae bacterium]
MSQIKRGRPTDNPKPHKLQLRVDDEDLKTLDDYCDRHSKSRTDGLRDGIKCLKKK